MVLLNIAVGFLHPKYPHNHKRYDLAYITPRLIASSMPTERFQQRLYRNSTKDLEAFLSDRHGTHWHVWNLQEDYELGYDPNTFGARGGTEAAVSRYPVLDHCPMPLATLIGIVRDIQTYLGKDENNVALVHCKCGKGRTGMVVAGYLMATNGYTFEQAIREFTLKRIRFGIIEGVSIPSQRRFLHYAEQYYSSRSSSLPEGHVRIISVIIRNPVYEDFVFTLRPLNTESSTETIVDWDVVRKSHAVVLRPLESQAVFPTDILCTFTSKARAGIAFPVGTASFAFNTVFEQRNSGSNGSELLPLAPLSATQQAIDSPPISLGTVEYGIHRFICHWGMTEGICGTALRGIRAFDSIEVLWKDEPEFDCGE